MANKINITREGQCAVLTLNSPPVNATSTDVRKALLDAVLDIQNQSFTSAILICQGSTFIAGGDMTEFDRPPLDPHLPDVVAAFENSKIPIIAALHGSVLGGGFEIAMGSTYRVAQTGTVCGMPEVNVGLIAGAGGTQRLPRLVGVDHAVKMLSDGKPRSVDELHELGAIDKIVDGDLLTEALKYANQELSPVVPISQRKVKDPKGADYFQEKSQQLRKKSKGQQSPLFNLDAVKWACELPFEDGQRKERDLHLRLRKSHESQALRHFFFAQKSSSSPPILKNVKGAHIEHVGVIGGGLMGAGISFASLLAGYSVSLIEVNERAIDQAKERIKSLIRGASMRGLIDDAKEKEIENQISYSSDYASLSETDLVIEAVVEDLDIKKSVFEKVVAHTTDTTILATNTSYLNPENIFKGLPNQSRCLGLHFFAPAHIMKLVEVIKTTDVSVDVLASVFRFTKKIKKSPVMCGICDGFIGNRILMAYRRQADYLLADGALPHEIDKAMCDFGFAVGPYEAQDMSGLQIAWANRQRQMKFRPPAERYVNIADQVCEAGFLGQRTGQGWYGYSDKKQTDHCTPEVKKIIETYSQENGLERHSYTSKEISDRLLAVIINEAAKILEDGIAQQASDIDIVEILGFGFPKWRGGPMKYAEMNGIEKVKNTFAKVENQSPNSWIRSAYLS